MFLNQLDQCPHQICITPPAPPPFPPQDPPRADPGPTTAAVALEARAVNPPAVVVVARDSYTVHRFEGDGSFFTTGF